MKPFSLANLIAEPGFDSELSWSTERNGHEAHSNRICGRADAFRRLRICTKRSTKRSRLRDRRHGGKFCDPGTSPTTGSSMKPSPSGSGTSTSGGSEANGDQGGDKMPDSSQGVRPYDKQNKPDKM